MYRATPGSTFTHLLRCLCASALEPRDHSMAERSHTQKKTRAKQNSTEQLNKHAETRRWRVRAKRHIRPKCFRYRPCTPGLLVVAAVPPVEEHDCAVVEGVPDATTERLVHRPVRLLLQPSAFENKCAGYKINLLIMIGFHSVNLSRTTTKQKGETEKDERENKQQDR